MKLRWLILAAPMLAWAAHAHAGEQDAEQCTAEVPAAPLADRTGTIASFERLSDTCLKRIAIECSDATNEHVLDLGAAAICSMGYEALLAKSFGGNFQAMLAWWQREHTQPVIQ
jgi:hypothetical protein